MATIRDVAKRAGVSISTISNVMNNKGNISDKKYKEVMQVIKDLNYRPNFMARNLKNQKTRFVAVVMPSLEGHYATILKGIQTAIEDLGYLLLLRVTGEDANVETQVLYDLIALDVCGLIIVPCKEDKTLYEDLIERKIPTVFLERKVEGAQFSAVVFDNRSIVEELAVNSIRQYGAEEVMLITGKHSYSSEKDCADGFLDAFLHTQEGIQEQQLEHIAKTQILTGSLNKEKVFYTLFDAISRLPHVPKQFIVSSTQVAQTLQEVLFLSSSSASILALGTEEWRRSNQKTDTLVKVPRGALRLGIESVKILNQYIKNAVLFENRIHVIKKSEQRPSACGRFKVSRGTKLRVLLLESPSADAQMKLSIGYCRRNGCEIEFDVVKDYMSLNNMIVQQMQQKQAHHDILMVDIPWLQSYTENKYLYNLSEFIPQKEEVAHDYPYRIQRAFMPNRSMICGFPVMGTMQFMFYRKDLFENDEIRRAFEKENGFALHPPRTWTEFNIVAKFFTRKHNPLSPVEYGTTLCAGNGTSMVDEFLPRMWSFGGSMLGKRGEVLLRSTENVRALDSLRETYQLAPDQCGSYWWSEALKDLCGGKYAMVQGFSSLFPASATSADAGEHYNNIGIKSLPGNKPVLGGWSLCVNNYCKQPKEAYSYIRWLVSDTYKIQHLLLGGALPSILVSEDTLLRTEIPWVKYQLQGFKESRTRDVLRDKQGKIVDPLWLDNTYAKYILRALRGQDTSKEALFKLEQELLQVAQSGENGWSGG